jgi:hypothetical protein
MSIEEFYKTILESVSADIDTKSARSLLRMRKSLVRSLDILNDYDCALIKAKIKEIDSCFKKVQL